MSPELIGIMTVGVAIAALQMVSIKGLREDIKGLREEMDKRFAALDQRFAAIDQRLAALEQRVGALEQRLARLEGMIDGLFNRRPQIETAPMAIESP